MHMYHLWQPIHDDILAFEIGCKNTQMQFLKHKIFKTHENNWLNSQSVIKQAVSVKTKCVII